MEMMELHDTGRSLSTVMFCDYMSKFSATVMYRIK